MNPPVGRRSRYPIQNSLRNTDSFSFTSVKIQETDHLQLKRTDGTNRREHCNHTVVRVFHLYKMKSSTLEFEATVTPLKNITQPDTWRGQVQPAKSQNNFNYNTKELFILSHESRMKGKHNHNNPSQQLCSFSTKGIFLFRKGSLYMMGTL